MYPFFKNQELGHNNPLHNAEYRNVVVIQCENPDKQLLQTNTTG